MGGGEMDFVLATEFQIEISEIMYEFREGTYKIFNTHKKCYVGLV